MATRETESGGSSGSSSGFCGSLGADSLDDPSAASTESIGFQQCYSTGESLIEPSRISQSSFDPIKQHLELELDRIATKIRGYSLERVLVESALSHPENQQGGPEAAAESGGDISIVLVERLRNLEDHLTGLRAHARVIHYLLHLRSESESRRSPYSLHDSLEELPTEETDSLDVTMTIDDSRLLGNSNPPISEKADDTKSAESPILADMRPIVQGNALRGKNYKTAEKERTFISPRKVCSQACASCCPILKGITEQEKSKDSSALAPLSGANQRLLKQRNAPAIVPLKTADGQSDHTPSVVAVVNPTTHQHPLPESDKKATDTEVNQNPLKNRLKRKSTYKVTQQHRQEKQNLLNEALVKLQIKLDDAEQKIKVLEEELKKATEPKSMKIIAPPKDNVNEKIRDKLEKECKTLKESLQEYTRKLEQANTKISELIKEKAELLHKLQVTETVATKQRDAAESEIQAMLSEKIMMMSKMSEMEGAFLKLKDRVSDAEMQATEERGLRLGLQSKLEEMKGRVRVYCRIRPIEIMDNGLSEPLAVEVGPNRYTAFVHLDANSSSSSSLNGRRDGNALKEFNFDRVFPPEATQEEVFQEARDLIECALDGYNVCICAYGQTGSGKTHTILGGGTEETCGLAPRTFSLLFELSNGGSSGGNSLRPAITRDLTVSVSILELYNERLIDLLRIDGTGEAEQLEICRSGGEIGGEVWVRGAKRVNVSDANCLCSLVQQAVAHRRTASTGMNAVSSRSHLLISLNIQATCSVTGSVSRGKISLLDLAGSERASRTGATDDRLREAGAINKSLSALGDVIYALATGQSFIPYRNSKLTMLMQDCLGGNAKTLMFVNVSPSASRVDETLTSLVYASRVKHITNTARKTADTKEIARLKKVIKKLQGRNDRSDIESDFEVS
ncbi:kinesin-like protein KIN-14M isoform X2 [Ischnura elegans]|uniref:kinesin-like protein KIN-14M isoform X2 n=1 Tax=Ischnura elegans TaxID=197161 RepID=UPI001ED8A266|nr:kinesin-like protein KIN-14M isoform X2 [Ischnura elegans]